MVSPRTTTPDRPDAVRGSQARVGTLRHAGCFLYGGRVGDRSGDNFRKDSTMRLMQQTFQMTDLRKRLFMLTLLSFVALC